MLVCAVVSSARPAAAAAFGDDVRAAVAPWLGCSKIADWLGANLDLSGDLALLGHVEARRSRGGVEIVAYQSGSGRDAYATEQTVRLVSGGCEGDVVTVEGPRNTLYRGVYVEALGTAPPPSLNEIALRLHAVLAKADDARFAAARLVLRRAAEPDDADAGTDPPAPVAPGRPTGNGATLWTFDEVVRADVAHPWRATESGQAFAALLVYPVRPPSRRRRIGRFELWELHYRFPHGGGLVAVYDRATSRSRWLREADDDGQLAAAERAIAAELTRGQLPK